MSNIEQNILRTYWLEVLTSGGVIGDNTLSKSEHTIIKKDDLKSDFDQWRQKRKRGTSINDMGFSRHFMQVVQGVRVSRRRFENGERKHVYIFPPNEPQSQIRSSPDGLFDDILG